MTVQTFDPNSTTGGSDPNASPFVVWTGGYEPRAAMTDSQSRLGKQYEMVTVDQYADNHMQSLNEQQLRQLQEQLFKTGYIPQSAVTGRANVYTSSGYQKFLTDVADETVRSGPITPEDYMQQALAAANKNSTNPNAPHSSTSTTIASPEDARSLALQTFQQLLGKRPSQKQMDAFYAALTTYEQANPSVTNTTSSANGNHTNSVTSGGADPAAFAQQYVDQNYGRQEGTHDALHYYDLVNQALTGPPPGLQHAN